MTAGAIQTLVLIAVVAVLAPIISELSGKLGIPEVVIQLGLGILIGPYVLGIASSGNLVTALSDMGLAYLMFLAGYELDLARIRGRPLNLAVAGWVMSVGIALLAAFILVSTGIALNTVVVALALTTTALGTLLPVLRDAGVVETDFGKYVLSVGTIGEFGPVVAVALLLTTKEPLITSGLLILFFCIAIAAAVLATYPHPPYMVSLLRRTIDSSAQLPVRVSMLLILVLVYLAFQLGLDTLLGAFAAGVVVRLFAAGEDSEVVRHKLEAIGFGFLVPIFFIVSGIHFNLDALLATPSTWLRLPLFLSLFLVVRGVPAILLYRRDLPTVRRVSLAFFSATGLPMIVVITSVGVAEGRMRPANAAALVGAGMLSVVIFPALGLLRLRSSSEKVVELKPASQEG